MFKLLRVENARMTVPEPTELEVTSSEEIKLGEALKLSSGKLTKCAATDAVQFVAGQDLAAAATNRKIQVWRVTPDQIWTVGVSLDTGETASTVAALNVGSCVLLDSTALLATCSASTTVSNTTVYGKIKIEDVSTYAETNTIKVRLA